MTEVSVKVGYVRSSVSCLWSMFDSGNGLTRVSSAAVQGLSSAWPPIVLFSLKNTSGSRYVAVS